MSDERFSRIETKIGELDRKIDQKFDNLGHQMRLLHEDVVGKIAALAPDYDEIDRRIAEGDSKVRAELLTRVEPLEGAERARRRR